jgi:hypothetical protein
MTARGCGLVVSRLETALSFKSPVCQAERLGLGFKYWFMMPGHLSPCHERETWITGSRPPVIDSVCLASPCSRNRGLSSEICRSCRRQQYISCDSNKLQDITSFDEPNSLGLVIYRPLGTVRVADSVQRIAGWTHALPELFLQQ